jgi:hypothetical protein
LKNRRSPIHRWLFAVAIGFMLWSFSPAYSDEVKVTSIEAFLVYSHSGKLSENVADPKAGFAFWNTIIMGESDGKGPASDVLIVAHFSRVKNKLKDKPVSMRVTDHINKKEYGNRPGLSLVFMDGNIAAQSMLLHNVTCDHLDVEVAVGKTKTKLDLPFNCGE